MTSHKEASIRRCASCGFIVRCEECPEALNHRVERDRHGNIVCKFCQAEGRRTSVAGSRR